MDAVDIRYYSVKPKKYTSFRAAEANFWKSYLYEILYAPVRKSNGLLQLANSFIVSSLNGPLETHT